MPTIPLNSPFSSSTFPSQNSTSMSENTNKNLTQKTSTVMERVGFSSNSSVTQQKVSSTGFLELARTIWQDCKTGSEFPLLSSSSAEKWVKTLVEKCPLEKCNQIIDKLSNTEVGPQVLYDIFKLSLKDTWIKIGLSQEQFPKLDPTQSEKERVEQVFANCPLDSKPKFVKELMQQPIYSNLLLRLTLSTDAKSYVLSLLTAAKELKPDELHYVLQEVCSNPSFVTIMGSLSFEEWKSTGLASDFDLLFYHEIPDFPEHKDPEFIIPSEELPNLTKDTITTVIPIRKTSFMEQSELVQRSTEAAAFNSSNGTSVYHREASAMRVFSQMMYLATKPSSKSSEDLVIDLAKKLSTEELWSIWKFSQELKIPPQNNLLALALDRVLVDRMAAFGYEKQTDQFIEEFIQPLHRQGSIRAYYENVELVQNPGYEAVRIALHNNLRNLLAYCDNHPEDFRVRNILYHTITVRLDSHATDQDLQKLCKYCPNLMKLDLSYCQQLTENGFINITELTKLEDLKLQNCTQLNDAALQSICQCSRLRFLDLSYCKGFTDAGFANIDKLTYLQTLKLAKCTQLNDTALKSICQCSRLRVLDLFSCDQLTDAGFTDIAKLSNLQMLNLEGCHQLNDAALKSICKCSSLVSLDLSYCRKITEAGFADIPKLSNLQMLNLEGCHQLNDATLKSICNHCSSLRSLDLSDCTGFTDAGFSDIAKLSSLQTLNLSLCDQLKDTALKSICECSSLRSLNLSACTGFTDAGFADIPKLSNLQTLHLNYCHQLTDAALKNICNHCASLLSLDLSFCKGLTDAGFADIPKLSNLQMLNLGNCDQLTDTTLKSICELKNLLSLNLSDCTGFTNAGFADIPKLSNLQMLNLKRCNQLNNAALEEMAKRRNLQITR